MTGQVRHRLDCFKRKLGLALSSGLGAWVIQMCRRGADSHWCDSLVMCPTGYKRVVLRISVESCIVHYHLWLWVAIPVMSDNVIRYVYVTRNLGIQRQNGRSEWRTLLRDKKNLNNSCTLTSPWYSHGKVTSAITTKKIGLQASNLKLVREFRICSYSTHIWPYHKLYLVYCIPFSGGRKTTKLHKWLIRHHIPGNRTLDLK